MYLVSAGRRTFRPWTHTSDDSSYMYQLSLECILILIIKKPTTPICGVVPPAWQVLSCLVIYLYVRTYVIYAGFKVEDTPRWVRTSGQNGTDSPWMSLNLCVMRRYYVSRGRGPGVIHTICCCCFYIIISNFLPNIISSTPRLSVLPDSSSLERYNLCGQRQQ